jgi:hypothetical protein
MEIQKALGSIRKNSRSIRTLQIATPEFPAMMAMYDMNKNSSKNIEIQERISCPTAGILSSKTFNLKQK